MAGLFDDLLPGGAGLFDDLLPQQGPTQGDARRAEPVEPAAPQARRGTLRGVTPYAQGPDPRTPEPVAPAPVEPQRTFTPEEAAFELANIIEDGMPSEAVYKRGEELGIDRFAIDAAGKAGGLRKFDRDRPVAERIAANTPGRAIAPVPVDGTATPVKIEPRGVLGKVNDSVIDAGNTIAGLVKTGVDLIEPGGSTSKRIESFIEAGRMSQSMEKQANRTRLADSLRGADGELDKAGRYLYHAIFEDPLGTVTEGVANVAGFGAAGTLLRGAGLGATALTGGSMALAGAATAGSVRGNIWDNINNRPDAVLMRDSPEYRELRAQGMTEDQAKRELGASVMRNLPELVAAGVIGALGGKYGLEGLATGARVTTGRISAGLIGIIDEASQGAIEQLASNFGTQRALPGQSLVEDVAMNAVAEGLPGLVGGIMAGGNMANIAQAEREDAQRAARKALDDLGRAMQEDVDNTVFTPEGTDGFARAALQPGSVLTDPNAVRPESTRKPVVLEDMPAKVLTPEQIAAIPAEPKLPEAVKPTKQRQPAAPAPDAIGVAAVPQGSIAARAQAIVGAQPVEPAAPAVAPTPPAAPVAPAVAPPAAPAVADVEAIKDAPDPVAVAPAADSLAKPFTSAAEAREWAAANGVKNVTPIAGESGFVLSPVMRSLPKAEKDAEAAALEVEKAKLLKDADLRGGELGNRVRSMVADMKVAPPELLRGTMAGALANISRVVFDFPVTFVTGMRIGGFANNGRAYVAVEDGRQWDRRLTFLIGHEVQHVFDKEGSFEAQALRDVVRAQLRPGAVKQRRKDENKGQTLDLGLAYAENEIAADLNGALWSDPEFWGRLYEVDNGNLFRKVMYQFMRTATKVLSVASGTRMDMSVFVKDIEAVREAAAQAWAARAQNVSERPKKAKKAKAPTPLARRAVEEPEDEFDEPDIPDDAYVDDEGDMLESPDQYDGPAMQDVVDIDAEELAAANAEMERAANDPDAELRQRKLEEELRNDGLMSPVRGTDPGAPNLQDVEDEAIEAAGILAETAYPALDFKPNDVDGRPRASVRLDSARTRSVTLNDLGSRYMAEGASVNIKPMADEGGFLPPELLRGQPTGALTLSEPRAREWARRFLAAGDLFRRGFDLLSVVPVDAAQRVRDVWPAIAALPRAFVFETAYITRGAPAARLQEVADAMLDGSGWSMSVTGDGARIDIGLTDPNGKTVEARIDYTKRPARAGGPEAVISASQLAGGSGAGRALYQVVAAWADQVGAQILADETGLTAINAYRRTDQMLSAYLRSEGSGRFQPGLAQRIYGWNVAPRGTDAKASNVTRLALAQARNVAEFYPAIEGMSYDIAADTFTFADGQDASPFIDGILSDPDLRMASISRSTMARAAVTFMAMRGDLDAAAVNKIDRVASPILYSRGDPMAVVSAPDGVAQDDAYSRFDGVDLSYQVRVADTGQVATVTVDGGRALRELDARRSRLRELQRCLA